MFQNGPTHNVHSPVDVNGTVVVINPVVETEIEVKIVRSPGVITASSECEIMLPLGDMLALKDVPGRGIQCLYENNANEICHKIKKTNELQ